MHLSCRSLNGLAALLCVALLGFAVYLQNYAGIEPCPLCIIQRGFFVLLAIFFFLGSVMFASKSMHRIFHGMIACIALGGACVAARQVWLQHLPADQVPGCGPDLAYMVAHFPFHQLLMELMKGGADCAAIGWQFLGLSIAEWSFISFIFFTVIALYQLSSRT